MTNEHQTSAVIIDDMPLARASLKADIEEHCPEISIIGEAESVISGLKLLKDIKPDLVFLDIELQDGLGFDILDIIKEQTFQVIFTTAQESYALRAFRVSAIDYLLKPIDPELLILAVQKASNARPQLKEQLSILKNELSENAKTRQIVLHTQEKITLVPVDDIIRCESEGNYTKFFLIDGTKHLIAKTLKEYESTLPKSKFIRTHQSHLVNKNQIKEFVKTEGGYLLMKDGSRVSVSVRKRTQVLKALKMTS